MMNGALRKVVYHILLEIVKEQDIHIEPKS